MSLRLGRKGETKTGKGLPPLPANSHWSENEGRKEKDPDSVYASFNGNGSPRRPSPTIITAGLNTPRFHRNSPTTTPTSYRSPLMTSASTSNLFETTASPASYHSFRHPVDTRPPFAPPSPSTASHHSLAPSGSNTATSTPRSKRVMFGSNNTKSSTKSVPSVRSSHTMPDMVAYNDVDQWGVGISSGIGGTRPPISPRKGSGLNTSPDAGLRRKNSSSKMLVKGLSRSLTRMGSVMKRSPSDTVVGGKGSPAGGQENWPSTKARGKRQSTVQEDMGEGWERVDMQREVTEGDTSITRPFNVEHNLHVSPDLDNLPPAWLEALKAQGLSEEDLLLIAAARQKAGQRPLLRIVKGSLPPGNNDGNDPTTPTTFSQARSRGLSTPAHLMLSQDQPDRPVLTKRFSWEKSPTTPTAASSQAEQSSPSTPLAAFRKSLQPKRSPVRANLPRHNIEDDIAEVEDTEPEREAAAELEATPKKNKRWSDQLRGFQTSFSTIGGDDDWGSSLTSVLNANFGLQTVQEGEERRQSGSMESARSAPPEPAKSLDRQKNAGANLGHLDNPMGLTIDSTPLRPVAGSKVSSPTSPSTPRGIRRKPVPSLNQPLVSPRVTPSNIRSVESSALKSGPKSPRSPLSTTPKEAISTTPPLTGSAHTPSPERAGQGNGLNHARYQSIGQSNDSELEHELRTPSTNDHFLLSPTSSESLSHPPLPRSVSNDSQWMSHSTMIKPTMPVPSPETDVIEGTREGPADSPWRGYAFPKDSPPRPDPRYSLPATVGYTESSPPSRSPSPVSSETSVEYSNDDHPNQHLHHHQRPQQHNEVPSPTPPSPRSPTHHHPHAHHRVPAPKATRPSSKSSTASSSRRERERDPLSRLDKAGTMSERASIALSMISSSNFSDARSSLNSLRDSYMHEAKVLKAYMRDPAELGGLRESDGEGTSDHGSHSDGHRHTGEIFDCYRPNENEGLGSLDKDQSTASPRSSHSIRTRKTVSSSPTSHRSPKSSIRSDRSRRVKQDVEPIERQHPFAYQPLEADREEDALLALDDAARLIAKERGEVCVG